MLQLWFEISVLVSVIGFLY